MSYSSKDRSSFRFGRPTVPAPDRAVPFRLKNAVIPIFGYGTVRLLTVRLLDCLSKHCSSKVLFV